MHVLLHERRLRRGLQHFDDPQLDDPESQHDDDEEHVGFGAITYVVSFTVVPHELPQELPELPHELPHELLLPGNGSGSARASGSGSATGSGSGKAAVKA